MQGCEVWVFSAEVIYVVVCVQACLLVCLSPFPQGGMVECTLYSWVCSSAAAKGADVGTSAVHPVASASVKVEADSFSIMEGDHTFGASQAGLSLLGWPTGV